MRAIALLLVLVGCAARTAFAGPEAPEPVRREILALYDGAFEPAPSDTALHFNVEMPLNHLGYVLRYHDLREGPPSDADTRAAAAVVTMFGADLADPAAYLGWLESAGAALPRFVSFGGLGVPLTAANLRRLNPVLARMGLRIRPDYVPGTLTSRVVALDPAVVGFESGVDPLPPGHPVVVRAGDEAEVGLEYETAVLGEPVRSIVVATGPGGGYVAGGFALSYDEGLDVKRWIVEPFEFLTRALGRPDIPVPDPTTASGRRIYFSHVDGDGWNNLSHASADMDEPQLSGEVMLERLIEPYPDLPVSVGLVGMDVDPELGGGEAAAAIARRIYALPQVEVASHTLSHPFFWGFFDPYSRERELALMDEAARAGGGGMIAGVASALGVGAGRAHSFVAGSNALPRAYLRDPFDFGSEVGGALRIAEGFAPEGKRAALYLWSGDTQPTEAAIRATREAGVRNMNGGDVRFDTHRPSIGYVAPLSRTVGAERQIYSGNSNENNYTKLWTDHFYGFRQARETFDRTEAPRRLKGVNVYYHSYSAERPAALDAVLTHLDWARDAHLTPVRASQYAAAADGFFSTRITALGGQRWRVENRDGLHTVRFDRAAEREVDLPRSVGVLGAARHGGSLYVALDAAVPAATVALRPRGGAEPAGDGTEALLADSRWLVRDLARAPCRIDFTAEGFGAGEFTFENLPAREIAVTARRDGAQVAALALTPRAGEPASFALPAGAPAPTRVSLRCAGEEGTGL